MNDKDYKYIMGYLVMFIIGVFVFYYGTDKNQIVSYMGFAGTVTSLILAVVALIYTFFQSTQSINYTKELSSTSDNFKEAVEELKVTQQSLAISVEAMSSLSNQVASVDNKVEYIVSTIFEKPSASSEPASAYDLQELKNILGTASVAGLLSIVVTCFQLEKPIHKGCKVICDEIFSNTISGEYCFGFLVGFCVTGLVTIETTEDNFGVNIHNQEQLQTELSNMLKMRLEHSDLKEYIREHYESIVRYYGFDLHII